MTLTAFSFGILHELRNRRLNLSPHQPASSMGVGTGVPAGACIVVSCDVVVSLHIQLAVQPIGGIFGKIVQVGDAN